MPVSRAGYVQSIRKYSTSVHWKKWVFEPVSILLVLRRRCERGKWSCMGGVQTLWAKSPENIALFEGSIFVQEHLKLCATSCLCASCRWAALWPTWTKLKLGMWCWNSGYRSPRVIPLSIGLVKWHRGCAQADGHNVCDGCFVFNLVHTCHCEIFRVRTGSCTHNEKVMSLPADKRVHMPGRKDNLTTKRYHTAYFLFL